MISVIYIQKYNDASETLRKEIAEMLQQIWPNAADDSELSHPLELTAHSFFCRVDGKLVAYTAVLQKDIVHAGVLFRLAGLSCVATLPEYRKLGFGSCLVRSATDWMAQKKQLDFGIFTCQPEFIHFYHRCGGWQVNPNVTLIGNAKPGALNSKTLSVAVLQRIFSRHAQKHKVLLTHGLINLDFPDGEFL